MTSIYSSVDQNKNNALNFGMKTDINKAIWQEIGKYNYLTIDFRIDSCVLTLTLGTKRSTCK